MNQDGRRAWLETLVYGLCAGLLIVVLKLIEYRFLVVEHSLEIYGGLVAVLFAGLGVWLGSGGACGSIPRRRRADPSPSPSSTTPAAT